MKHILFLILFLCNIVNCTVNYNKYYYSNLDNVIYNPNHNYISLINNIYNFTTNNDLYLPNYADSYKLYIQDIFESDIYVIDFPNYNSNDTIIITNNYNNDNKISLFDFTGLWIIYSGLILGAVFLFFIYICIRNYKKELYSFLANVDLLYIDYSEEFLTTDDSNDIVSLGLGYNTRSRTTVLGGIFTILIILIGLFLISSYLYQTLKNNNIQTISLGLSSNNIIPISSSFLELELNLYNVFNCSCEDINYKFTGIKGNIDYSNIKCNLIQTDYICSNYSIQYKCTECVVDTGVDSYLHFSCMNYNSFYTGVSYKISTNSYFTDSILSGYLSVKSDSVLYDDSTLISLSTTPSLYNEYDTHKSVGFVLDYNNIFIGKSTNIQNKLDSINNIGLNIKISRNLNWMFITISERFSGLVIFSQTFSIIGGIFAVSKFILNLVSRKTVRKFAYDFLKNKKYNNKITHKMKVDKLKKNEKNKKNRKKIQHHKRNSIISLSEIKLHTIK
jgi:hypothetical protein